MLAASALLASSCQTAQKPASLLPQKSAPTLTASTAAASPAQQAAPAAPQVAAPPQQQAPAPAPAEAPPEDPSPAPVSDSVADLIAKVEKDFQAGMTAYRAGYTDAAKADFDKAFNALLDSDLDIRSDERLEQEFDRIVEGERLLG